MSSEDEQYIAHEQSASVTINEEVYCLLEEPSKCSKSVQDALAKLRQDCNLETIRKIEFLKSGSYLANLFMIASSMKLKMKINEISLDLLKLCNDCIFEFNGFCRTSRTIIKIVNSSYEYLLDGFKEESIKCLEFISTEYKNIKRIRSKLDLHVDTECNKVLKLTETVKKYDLQSEDQYDHVIKTLHQIQDNVFYIKDAMIETSQTFDISYLETDGDSLLPIIKDAIKNEKKHNKKKQHDTWISETFKKNFVVYQCDWVGFNELCSSFISTMKEFEENVRKCIHASTVS